MNKAEKALAEGVPEDELPQDQREALQRSRELGLDTLKAAMQAHVSYREFVNGSALLGIEVPTTLAWKWSNYMN